MRRRVVWIAVAAAAVLAALTWVLTSGPPSRPRTAPLQTVAALPTPTPAPEQRIILLFAGSDGMLHPELRSVPLPDEVEARIAVVLRELFAGPTGTLAPVVPYPVALRAAFVDGNGAAFVDISPPPTELAGSHTEIILTYGVVNSILLNCPELHAVQLLFGGQELPTLTGHLDLSKPMVLNKRFIAAS